MAITVFGTFYFHSTQKVDSLLALFKNSEAYSKYSEKELIKICTDAYKLSKKLNYEEGTSNAIQKILTIKVNSLNTENFETYLSEGIVLAERRKDISFETRLLMCKSLYYTNPAARILAFLEPAKRLAHYRLIVLNGSKRSFWKP